MRHRLADRTAHRRVRLTRPRRPPSPKIPMRSLSRSLCTILARALLCLVASTLLARPADAQRREVFSGLYDLHTAEVSPDDQALLGREIPPVARRLWGRVEGCRDELRALDAAAGSFTRRGAPQRAVLYRFCQAGHDVARGGVAIVQDGRVVAHLAIEDAQPEGIRALADIDRDGVSELLLVDSAMHRGDQTTHVSILQLVAGGVRSFGRTRVYANDLPIHRGDDAYRSEGREVGTELYATPARRPVFEAQTFLHRDIDRSRWRGIDRIHRIALDPDRTTYRRLR